MYTNKTFTSVNSKEPIDLFNPPIEMHHLVFTTDREDPKDYIGQLTLWVNDKSKVYIEVSDSESQQDLYSFQHVVLGKKDILKLIEELERIVSEYEFI